MSTFVDSLKEVCDLNDEYNAVVNQKKQEFEEASEKFNSDMRERIKFFNQVLYNTFIKFNQTPYDQGGGLTIGKILYDNHKINPDAVFTGAQYENNELILVSIDPANIKIPYALLRYDPIAVSQYARFIARKEQIDYARTRFHDAQKAQGRLQTQVNRLNKELADAKLKAATAERQVDHLSMFILNKKRGLKKK